MTPKQPSRREELAEEYAKGMIEPETFLRCSLQVSYIAGYDSGRSEARGELIAEMEADLRSANAIDIRDYVLLEDFIKRFKAGK